jgi:hypothetical protein
MTTASARHAYGWLWGNRRTATFLGGVTVSAIGDGAAGVALPLLALQLHGSVPAAVAVAALEVTAYVLPIVVSLTVGLGRWRFAPRTALIVDAALRAVMFGAVGALGVAGLLHLGVVIALLLVGSGLRLLASTGRRLLVLDAAGSSGVLAANGVLSTIDSVALFAVGPALGGLMCTVWSPSVALLADAATYAILFAVTLLAIGPRREPDHAAADGASRTRTRTRSGWHAVRAAPLVLVLLGVVFAYDLFYGPVDVALPLLVTVDLGRGGGTLGALWGVFGVGAVISSALTPVLARFRPVPVLLVIIGAWAGCDVLLGLSPTAGAAMLAMGFGGLVYGPFTAVAYTLLHGLVDVREQAAVFAVWSGALALALPLGLGLGGPLVALVGPRLGLLVAAALTIALVPIAAVRLSGTAVNPSVDVPPTQPAGAAMERFDGAPTG